MKLTGWLRHAVIGSILTGILLLLHTPPLAIVVAILAVGVSHEVGDGDFINEPNSPWNGVWDVLAFLVGALLFLALNYKYFLR